MFAAAPAIPSTLMLIASMPGNTSGSMVLDMFVTVVWNSGVSQFRSCKPSRGEPGSFELPSDGEVATSVAEGSGAEAS